MDDVFTALVTTQPSHTKAEVLDEDNPVQSAVPMELSYDISDLLHTESNLTKHCLSRTNLNHLAKKCEENLFGAECKSGSS